MIKLKKKNKKAFSFQQNHRKINIIQAIFFRQLSLKSTQKKLLHRFIEKAAWLSKRIHEILFNKHKKFGFCDIKNLQQVNSWISNYANIWTEINEH